MPGRRRLPGRVLEATRAAGHHALAAALGLQGLATSDEVTSEDQVLEAKNRSTRLVLARSRDALGALARSSDWWRVPVVTSGGPDRRFLWTDDRSSVLPVLRIG